jgi:heme/copper-type cytochrome/quinol oxidase subunit 3
MKAYATIDVSDLPPDTMDHRSPIWWGNLLLLVIETTMFAITIAAYFYLRIVDFDSWPPSQVNTQPPVYHPVPALLMPTLNLVILLVSFAPMLWASRACLKQNTRAVTIGLVLTVLLGILSTVVRFYEFPGIHFKWNDNAYASIVWLLLGLHLAHIITATAENSLMTVWVMLKGLDHKHARDVRVTATYWYWVVGMWVLLYILIYWGPRWL